MCGRRICEGSLGFLKTFSIYKKKKKGGGGGRGQAKVSILEDSCSHYTAESLHFPKPWSTKQGLNLTGGSTLQKLVTWSATICS